MAASLSLLTPFAASAADAPANVAIDGARLRLVAEPPSATGEVRAALLVDLEPGWKTYWLDPGDAGIPPRLDASASANLVSLDAGFPMPHRVDDPYGDSNVYSQPFALALAFRRVEAGKPSSIDLALTLGLCREICIPLSTRLGLDIADPSPADARLVAYAFDALPEPSTRSAGVQAAHLSKDGRTIEIEALAPDDRLAADIDLFLAGSDGWFFGRPDAPRRDGRRLVFSVPITARPKSAGTAPPSAVDAVLLLGARAFRADRIPVAAPN